MNRSWLLVLTLLTFLCASCTPAAIAKAAPAGAQGNVAQAVKPTDVEKATIAPVPTKKVIVCPSSSDVSTVVCGPWPKEFSYTVEGVETKLTVLEVFAYSGPEGGYAIHFKDSGKLALKGTEILIGTKLTGRITDIQLDYFTYRPAKKPVDLSLFSNPKNFQIPTGKGVSMTYRQPDCSQVTLTGKNFTATLTANEGVLSSSNPAVIVSKSPAGAYLLSAAKTAIMVQENTISIADACLK